MRRILSGLHDAAPAIVMVAGTLPFYQAEVSQPVQCGGMCLTAIALLLVDMQSKKKLGYTDAIVAAVRKVPGMEKADEGDIIGALTLSASSFLGIPTTMGIVESGNLYPGIFNQFVNYAAYPAGAAFAFRFTREKLEKVLGKTLSFSYQDADGHAQKTTPVETTRLMQQIAFFSGALGIAASGTALGAADIQFTGIMFGLANGVSISRLTHMPVSEVMQAKMETLARNIEQHLKEEDKEDASTAKAHMVRLREQWKAIAEEYRAGKPVGTPQVKDMGLRLAAVLSRVVAGFWTAPQQAVGKDDIAQR